MKTNPPLGGSLGVVVLDPETLEHPDGPIIHADGKIHVEFPHGVQQHLAGALRQVEDVGAGLDLLLGNLERIVVIVSS